MYLNIKTTKMELGTHGTHGTHFSKNKTKLGGYPGCQDEERNGL